MPTFIASVGSNSSPVVTLREVYANEFQATSPELGAFTGALIGISKAIVVFKLSVILVKSNFSAVTSVISAGGVVDQLGLLHPAGNGVGLDPAISSRQGLSTVVYDHYSWDIRYRCRKIRSPFRKPLVVIIEYMSVIDMW